MKENSSCKGFSRAPAAGKDRIFPILSDRIFEINRRGYLKPVLRLHNQSMERNGGDI